MKSERHPAILALVATEPIGTQAGLKRRLARAGHPADPAPPPPHPPAPGRALIFHLT